MTRRMLCKCHTQRQLCPCLSEPSRASSRRRLETPAGAVYTFSRHCSGAIRCDSASSGPVRIESRVGTSDRASPPSRKSELRNSWSLPCITVPFLESSSEPYSSTDPADSWNLLDGLCSFSFPVVEAKDFLDGLRLRSSGLQLNPSLSHTARGEDRRLSAPRPLQTATSSSECE